MKKKNIIPLPIEFAKQIPKKFYSLFAEDFNEVGYKKNVNRIEFIIKELEDKIKDGDHFVFADAWHPGILNLKYMSALMPS